MSIRLQFISVVIPIDVIEAKCQHLGGFKGVLALNKPWVGKRILYDDQLYKDGAMDSEVIEDMLAFWEQQGLTLRETKDGKAYWKDVCVVDQIGGPTLPCEWLAYDWATSSASKR